MKQLIKSIALVGLMSVGGSAWAIPFTVGFTLQATTNGATVCVDGCSGSLTTVNAANGFTNGQLGIDSIDLDVDVNGTNIHFGSVVTGIVTIIDSLVSHIDIAISNSINPAGVTLVLASNYNNGQHVNTGYTIAGIVDGQIVSAQGSHVSVPEPGVIGLLSLGLMGLAFTRRSKKAIN